jgi:NADH-quinone oxidoreductase E subunit
MALSEKALAEIDAYKALYPNARSALLPALWVAHEDNGGYLSREAMEDVARAMDLTPADVISVASFYSMYNKVPVGKYLIEVCTNISCSLLGADRLARHLEERVGVGPGAVSADGLFTIKHVECMAACGGAPAIQVNSLYFESMTPEKVDRLLGDLRAGKELRQPLRGEPDGPLVQPPTVGPETPRPTTNDQRPTTTQT